MKYKVGDRVRIKTNLKAYESANCYVVKDMINMEGQEHIIERISPNHNYKIFTNDGCDYWWFSEEMLEPAYADGGYVPYHKIPTPSKPVPIEEQLGLPKGVSIHDLPTSEWYNPMRLTFKNGSSIEAIPNEDAIRSKEPELVWIDKIALPTATETKEMVERVRREILKFTNAFPKEEKKLKFTFYTEEGYRIDKSNNSKVETITTFVKINGFDNTYLGMATCDKVNYSEREGVINALANAMCNGNFDREFNKAVKDVERKKARRERYLLRKRAKEIAFEEQAQKMAKEIIAEGNKK